MAQEDGTEDALAVQATGVILGLWNDVIRAVNTLIRADEEFGFAKIESKLNPSLASIVHGLGLVEFALSTLVDSGRLGHDNLRLALNAKQCVLHIRRVSAALSSGDNNEYDQAIKALNDQAQI